MPNLETLKLNKEFKRAYYQGKSKATPYFICYKVKNRRQGIRYGITTSKKLGNAVMRNRTRRLLRVAIITLADHMEPNYDYVFVARERILAVKSDAVVAMMKKTLGQLSIPDPRTTR